MHDGGVGGEVMDEGREEGGDVLNRKLVSERGDELDAVGFYERPSGVVLVGQLASEASRV